MWANSVSVPARNCLVRRTVQCMSRAASSVTILLPPRAVSHVIFQVGMHARYFTWQWMVDL